MPTIPVNTSPIAHVQRAFGWNLGKVVPSQNESTALARAGVNDPTIQRYAVWRKSLLLVAIVPTFLAFVLAVIDTFESGFGEFTKLGIALEVAWLVAAAALSIACFIGIRNWKRPGSASGILIAAWAGAFLLPFVYALLPASSIYHVQEIAAKAPVASAKQNAQNKTAKPAEDDEDDEKETVIDPAKLEKLQAMEELAVEFVLSGSGYLLLLPAVLSLIPGAVNGCLRIKSLMPAAQLPGWLLVCAAPAFLLFWMVILVIANHAARSPYLVFGVLLWAGAPIWFSIRGKVFVQSQIGEKEAARIAGVKRLVLITTLIGVALMLTFVLTTKVVGLNVVGFDRAKAVSTKIEQLSDDDEVSLEDVQTALSESKSFIYAFDLSSWRFVVDFLAKFFVVLAVFADLILRATLSAWRNDRALRASAGSKEYDQAAESGAAVLG